MRVASKTNRPGDLRMYKDPEELARAGALLFVDGAAEAEEPTDAIVIDDSVEATVAVNQIVSALKATAKSSDAVSKAY